MTEATKQCIVYFNGDMKGHLCTLTMSEWMRPKMAIGRLTREHCYDQSVIEVELIDVADTMCRVYRVEHTHNRQGVLVAQPTELIGSR